MKKIFLLHAVITLTLFFVSSNIHAQWVNLRTPFGIYGLNNIEFHKGKTITSMHTLSQIRFAQSGDNVSWELVKILGANAQHGKTRTYSDGSNLHIFAWNPASGVATAHRSLDDGVNWNTVNLPSSPLFTFLPFENRLFCASKTTLYRSITGGGSWQTALQVTGEIFALERFEQGKIILATHKSLYVSTDGGFQWMAMPAPYDTTGAPPAFLQVFPHSGVTFIAVRKALGMHLYRTNDGGENWTELLLEEPYRNAQVIKQIRAMGNTLWALFDHQLARSDDGGATWENAFSPKATEALNVKGNTLFVGGPLGFFTSTDFAKSWLTGNAGWGGAGDNLGSYKPATLFSTHNSRIYFAGGEGLYSTNSQGQQWTLHHYRQGEAFTHFFSSGDTLVLTGRDGLLRSFDGGANWEWLVPTDINGKRLFEYRGVARAGNYLFACTFGDPGMYRSSDFGESWQILPASLGLSSSIVGLGEQLFVLGGSKVKRSLDFGETYEEDNAGVGTLQQFEKLWKIQDQLYAVHYQQFFRRDTDGWKNAGDDIFVVNSTNHRVLDMAGNSNIPIIAYHNFLANSKPFVSIWDHLGQKWTGDLVENILPDIDLKIFLDGNDLYVTARDVLASTTKIWKRSLTVNAHSPDSQINDWKLSPNPSHGDTRITLDGPAQHVLKVSVFDMIGKLVWSVNIPPGQTNCVLSLGGLPNGVYTVLLSGQHGQNSQQRLIRMGH